MTPPPKLEKVQITPHTAALSLGQSVQLSAIAVYTDGSSADETLSAKWSSGDTSVLEISSGGLAKSAGLGSTSVSAAFKGVTASITVAVTAATPVSFHVTPLKPVVALGQSVQLSAVAVYSDGSSIDQTTAAKWSSADASIVEIGSAGVARAKGVGSASASAAWNGMTASLAVTVLPAAPVSISISPSPLSLHAGEKQQLKANVVLTDGTVQDVTGSVRWDVSDPAIASINTSGLLAGLKSGIGTVSASLDKITAASQVSISPAVLESVSLSADSNEIPVGETIQMHAQGAYSDGTVQDISAGVSWSSSASSVAAIDSSGLATAQSVGIATISARSGNISSTFTLNVSAPQLSKLTIAPETVDLLAGAAGRLKAVGTFTDGQESDVSSTAQWTVEDGSIVELGEPGTIVGVHAGATQVTAKLGGIVAAAAVVVRPVALITYFAAPAGAPDATLRISAAAGTDIDSCAMVYVFSSDQRLTECCGCTVSTGGLRTLSLSQDLLANPLTRSSPDAGSIVVITADKVANAGCEPDALAAVKAGLSWSTHLQDAGTAMYMTETSLSPAQISDSFLTSVQAECSFVKQLGSGRGICSCGTGN